MAKYNALSEELQERIKQDRKSHCSNPYKTKDEDAIRRDSNRDKQNLWRPSFIRDVDKIMHNPFYNRYTDKTQVFSFYKNDDISRRGFHVQLVSRIARNIGRMLDLNMDLIEAIALGHDMGHTPFGHAGERFLNEIYHERTGRYFNHNVHSVRVLDKIFSSNITLQTLDGIICHNGEMELEEYRPAKLESFEAFDKMTEDCYVDEKNIKKLIPSTLEGCVVRISDMIAYLGKDRQDAVKARIIKDDSIFTDGIIGKQNAEMINNLVVNIVENSYGKDYLAMDREYFEALKTAKDENYRYIYKNENVDRIYQEQIRPMFDKMYERLLKDVTEGNKESLIYKHHIHLINENRGYYSNARDYWEDDPNQIVVDFIASMTDDYFIDLYGELGLGKQPIEYVSYFQ